MKLTDLFIISFFLSIVFACKNPDQSDNKSKKRERKVFAHLMPQRFGDYGDQVSHLKPLIGVHDPFDKAAIEYHVLSAKAARIDGFIINPTFFKAGPTNQNKIMLSLMNAIVEMNKKHPDLNFRYIFSYDDNQRDEDKVTREIITENYQWIRENVLEHPIRCQSYFRDDLTGKKVMMVWSGLGRPSHWQAVGDVFGHDSVLLITRSAKPNDPYADGNFSWIFSDTTMLARVPNNWGEKAMDDFFMTMQKRDSGRIIVSSVYPGFDDRYAGWGGGWRHIRRFVDDGEVMALTWDKNIAVADKLGISWIQIVTWNDWPEGSSVEPATLPPDGNMVNPHFGFQALETCRRKIIEFKQLENISEHDGLSIRIPYRIYQLRMSGYSEKADTIVNLFINKKYTETIER